MFHGTRGGIKADLRCNGQLAGSYGWVADLALQCTKHREVIFINRDHVTAYLIWHRIEMQKPISKLFEEARATCVDWEGQPLYGLYEIAAPGGLIIELSRSKESPVQGLALKAYGGVLRVGDVKAPEMVIWADTAPSQINVSFDPVEARKANLKIWNIWRGKVGGLEVTQAWLGNAGMRIERSGSDLFLRCSDGEGPINFSDLEARVTML